MIIGVSVNEVLRDFVGQFIHVYEKYIEETTLLKEDINDLDFSKFFLFKDGRDLNKFMFIEAPLEIFGHAGTVSDAIVTKLNLLQLELKEEGLHTLQIVSREVNKAKPSTLFFLSKTGCQIDVIKFVSNVLDKWVGVDVLITANPNALENKPVGKISVKIKTPYNTNIKADYELDSLADFIENKDLLNKILNGK